LLAEMFDGNAPLSAAERVPSEISAISEDEAEALLLEELEGREYGARQ
jgi:hypothetical protein